VRTIVVVPLFETIDPGGTLLFAVWDDTDNRMEFRSASDYRLALGVGTADSPTFAGLTISGSGAGALVLDDSDASNHFRLAANPTVTTNVNLIMPPNGLNALLKMVPGTGTTNFLLTNAVAGTDYSTSTSTENLQNKDLTHASNTIPVELGIVFGDESTTITTGTAKKTFRMPFAMTVTAVRANLKTASSSGNPAFDINEGGASIFSTTITIDANERTSTTAATAAVLSDTSLADDAEITIDIDTAGTGAVGPKIWLIGTR
jgi:hypothetical protein